MIDGTHGDESRPLTDDDVATINAGFATARTHKPAWPRDLTQDGLKYRTVVSGDIAGVEKDLRAGLTAPHLVIADAEASGRITRDRMPLASIEELRDAWRGHRVSQWTASIARRAGSPVHPSPITLNRRAAERQRVALWKSSRDGRLWLEHLTDRPVPIPDEPQTAAQAERDLSDVISTVEALSEKPKYSRPRSPSAWRRAFAPYYDGAICSPTTWRNLRDNALSDYIASSGTTKQVSIRLDCPMLINLPGGYDDAKSY